MTEQKRYAPIKTIRSIIKLLKMVFDSGPLPIIFNILVSTAFSLLPAVTALLWQQILQSTDMGRVSVIWQFAALAITGGLMVSYFYFTEVMDTIIRNRISKYLQGRIHKKAEELPMDSYENAGLNDTLNRASEIFYYGEALGFIVVLLALTQQIIAIASMGFVLWSFHPLLIVSALLMLVPCLVKLRLSKLHVDLNVKLSQIRRETDGLRRYLTKYEHIKELRAFEAEQFFQNRWRTAMDRILIEEQGLNRRITSINIILDSLERCATIAAYFLCVYFVLQGHIGIAAFGAVILLVGQFTQKYSFAIRFLQDLFGSALSIQVGMEYFDLQTENRNNSLSSPIESVKLDNVSYTYPLSEKNAVANINLSLRAGETIAVVGKNGSGKSTLSKLVLGLIDPTNGTLKVNDVFAKDVDYPSLYKNSTSVFQDHNRYYLRLRDNITISSADKKADDKKLLDLLQNFHINFAGGKDGLSLDTQLGIEYGGTELSGGQWQQLAIARAGFKQAQLVVLDEPTSALDPLKEAEMYESFQRLCKNKIGMFITHRLGLCAFADRILVMDGGKIVELGTHQELIEQKGIYAHMHSVQKDLYSVIGY